jgi:perosamine synthetase
MRLLRNHGMSRQYHHEILGWNWRLSDILSAIGICQVARLDQILERKRANAQLLAERLGGVEGVTLPATPEGSEHTYMIYSLQLDPELKPKVTAALDAAGIEWRLYFPPAHRQPVFAHLADPGLPETDAAVDRLVSIPFHSKLSSDELGEIADVVRSACR